IHHLKATIHSLCRISFKSYTPFFPFFPFFPVFPVFPVVACSPSLILPCSLTLVLSPLLHQFTCCRAQSSCDGRRGGIVSVLLVVLSCYFLKFVCMDFLNVVFVCTEICGLDGLHFWDDGMNALTVLVESML
ncbi:hypothetical protein VIGAN_04190000, partial [Vigna angularis var. angularis]